MKREHHVTMKAETGVRHLCPAPLELTKRHGKDTPLEPSERAWLDFRLVAFRTVRE